MRKPSKAERQLRKLQATAYHEAGHAVVSLELGRGFKSVSIEPDDNSLGRIQNTVLPEWFSPDLNLDDRHKKWIEREVLIFLAGIAAEHRFAGQNNWKGSGSDFHSAINLASCMFEGSVLEKYVAFMLERTRAMISHPRVWVQIQAVAEALLEHRVLSKKRVREICRIAYTSGAMRRRED